MTPEALLIHNSDSSAAAKLLVTASLFCFFFFIIDAFGLTLVPPALVRTMVPVSPALLSQSSRLHIDNEVVVIDLNRLFAPVKRRFRAAN